LFSLVEARYRRIHDLPLGEVSRGVNNARQRL
jgi:hypothetical protein